MGMERHVRQVTRTTTTTTLNVMIMSRPVVLNVMMSAFSLDRAQPRLVELIFLFVALYRDRVQQHLMEQAFALDVFASAIWSSSGAARGVPVEIGAPSRAHGLSFIMKLQPVGTSWRPCFDA